MRKTIKNYKDFNFGENAPSVASKFFVVKARPTITTGDARYGIAAPKKSFKLAVQRNRAKRLLREWIRKSENLMSKNTDYIFIARLGILNATLADGAKATEEALNKISAL